MYVYKTIELSRLFILKAGRFATTYKNLFT
jgi:hypothetical protein